MDKKPTRGRALSTGPLNAGVAREIDENLRRVYQEELQGDIPDRFRVLLDALRAREAEAAAARQAGTGAPEANEGPPDEGAT